MGEKLKGEEMENRTSINIIKNKDKTEKAKKLRHNSCLFGGIDRIPTALT